MPIRFDCINKTSDQNLRMKSILYLTILATLTSHYSILALKCYNCTEECNPHCRFLVPDNTQKILTEIWHHFWLKNDGEKWSRKNYFEIPRWPSKIPANLPGQFSLSGQQLLWRPSWNFKIIFSRPLFIIIGVKFP